MGLASERRGRRPRRAGDSAPLAQLPWKQPRRGFPPVRLLSDDQIETIHRAALDLLEDIGMDILYPQARQILADAGAIVAGERVRIGRDIIEAAIGTAPEEFTFHARNPSRSIRIGGDWIAFAPVGGPPNCSDADHGRRPGTFADNANFIRLAQHFNCIHTAGGGSTDALDVHASVRHLRIGLNKVLLSDKALFTSSTGRARLFDGIEMARIARGVGPLIGTLAAPLHQHQLLLAAQARLPDARRPMRFARRGQPASPPSRWPAPWRR